MNLARQFEKSLAWRLTAIFAVLLIAGMGYAQAVHLHDDFAPSGSARSHCALCVFSHSPAAVSATGSAFASVSSFVFLHSAEPQLHSRLLVAVASIRPPPASL